MRASTIPLATLGVLAITACGTGPLDALPTDRVPFTPPVGAPDGWYVEQISSDLTCPDGSPARLAVVYPESADIRIDPQAPAMPTALIFHSGPFDFSLDPAPGNPLGSGTFQQDFAEEARLTLAWTAHRVFTMLGLYPNLDGAESHSGALVAALATKGIASVVPYNCWGDLWHNRQSLVDNDYARDLFFRDGRTAAEFAWRYTYTAFPPANPLELPFVADGDRIFAVGLGEGARAVGELLAVEETVDGRDVFPFTIHAAVVDSPVDDLEPYFEGEDDDARRIQTGLARIFPGVETAEGKGARWNQYLSKGSLWGIPDTQIRAARLSRLGILVSDNDLRIPETANDRLFGRFGETSGTLGTTGDLWVHRGIAAEHILSNDDVGLAKAVADFLGGGLTDVDEAYVD